MKTYRVTATRVVQQETHIDVHAVSPDQALQRGLADLRDFSQTWTTPAAGDLTNLSVQDWTIQEAEEAHRAFEAMMAKHREDRRLREVASPSQQKSETRPTASEVVS